MVPKPWMPNPSKTVKKYQPSLVTVSAIDSISTIFETTKKKTPAGETLKGKNYCFKLNMLHLEINKKKKRSLPNNPVGDNHHSFTQCMK